MEILMHIAIWRVAACDKRGAIGIHIGVDDVGTPAALNVQASLLWFLRFLPLVEQGQIWVLP